MESAIRAITPHAPGHLELVLFRISGETCALPMANVREIVHMAELSCPPGLPSILEGFLELDGEALPVVNSTRLFGTSPQQPELYTPLILLRDVKLALLVESVDGTFSGNDDDLQVVDGKHTINRCVSALVKVDGSLVHLLDAERILLEEERQRIDALTELAQARLAALETETEVA